MKALYLDDVRTPQHAHGIEWHVVRSYASFVAYIKENGLPDLVSFDHDLGYHMPEFATEQARNEALRQPKIETDQGWFAPCVILEKSGYQAALWLLGWCYVRDLEFPDFTVHSANKEGATRILSLLNNFREKRGQLPTGYRTVW